MYSPNEKMFFCFICLAYLSFPMKAQEALSLDSCRALAISNNKELLISQEKTQRCPLSKEMRHLLITFPTFGSGGYMRSQKELSILSDAQKGALSGLGTSLSGPFTAGCPSHRTASSRTGRPIAGFRTKPGRCPRRCRPILG